MPLYLVDEGEGPVIVLAHALGCDLSMWDEVASLLIGDFRVIRFDHLGHGKSPQISGHVAIGAFTDAVAAMMRKLDLGDCLFAGVSMGAMVGMDLANRYRHQCTGVVLANATHYYDAPSRLAWRNRIDLVNANGTASVADMALDRWLSPTFRSTEPQRTSQLRSVLCGMQTASYVASCQAVSEIDFRDVLPHVRMPSLLIAGSQDVATPPSMLEHMHQLIASSAIEYLDAGHLSAVEKPHEFALIIQRFYARLQKEI
jgi:3-oxoadipate enol-lactonase